MKQLKDIITEKLRLDKNVKKKHFSDEELLHDYEKIGYAFTKNQKKEIANKYGVTEIKIEPIKRTILYHLRDNRNNKTKFTSEDVKNFLRLNIPDTPYSKVTEYFDLESPEFLEYLLKDYEKRSKRNHISNAISIHLSSADKHIIRRIDQLKRYLNK